MSNDADIRKALKNRGIDILEELTSYPVWETKVLQEAVNDAVWRANDQFRKGGYIANYTVEGAIKHFPLLIQRLGPVSDAKASKYFTFAQEKASRLAQNEQHVSSWQSRNPAEDKWGGAIKAGPFILSFSGLPELADEAAMLLVAVRLELLSNEEAVKIAEISSNRFFLDYL